MGALVGVLGRRDENTVPLVITMLQELVHRGNQGYKVSTPAKTVSVQSIADMMKLPNVSSNVAIGRNLSSGKELKSSNAKSSKVAFEGRVFSRSGSLDPRQIAADIENSAEEIGEKILRDFDGSYAFASASDEQMLIGRDPLGIMPLYYGKNESVCAVASERKALWKIGIHDARPFPPGNLGRVDHYGFSFKPVWTIRPSPHERIASPTAASDLRNLLEESIRERLRDAAGIGIAFSGGLDSSIIAHVVRESGIPAQLISVCLGGQPGALHAEKAAGALQLPITIRTYDVTDVENTLARVLWLIEEPDAMKAGIAIPLFWSAHVASKLGCDIMLSGQGADELFGGYRRYLTRYKTKDSEEVAEMLLRDTLTSYDRNFQRDEPLCAYNKIELRLPYADTSFVRCALDLPVAMKIQSADDLLRKRILRQLAKSLGVPAFIADRPKKAIQYETGVDKALRNLARGKGLTLHEYIKQVFNTVYPTLEGKRSEHSDLLQPDLS